MFTFERIVDPINFAPKWIFKKDDKEIVRLSSDLITDCLNPHLHKDIDIIEEVKHCLRYELNDTDESVNDELNKTFDAFILNIKEFMKNA